MNKGNGKQERMPENYKRVMVNLSFSQKDVEKLDAEMKRRKFKKRAVFARWCIDRYLDEIHQGSPENV